MTEVEEIETKQDLVKSIMASVLVLALIITVISVSACKSPASTPAETFQTLANDGQVVYSNTCAVCHGNNGQPANKYTVLLWSTGSTLGTYDGITLFTDARGMLDYMSRSMPLEAPGSLTNHQYIELLAYILIKANKVSPSTVFDENKLINMSIP